MRGLLIKDFQIMAQQRKFLILVMGISVVMGFSMGDTSFLMGYITLMCAMLVLNTLSYDEYDNGYCFLFTLPITRKGYVLEKYVLAGIVSVCSWFVSVLLCMGIAIATTGSVNIGEMLAPAIITLLVCLLMLFVMMPVQMKYGSEKSRVVIVAIAGGIVLVCYLLKALSDKLQNVIAIDAESMLLAISRLGEAGIIAIAVLIVVVIMAITMSISIKVMEKKQM